MSERPLGPVKAPKKQRLDTLIVARGLAEDLSRAKALILAGRVIVGEQRRDKAGEKYAPNTAIRVKGRDDWASRGAHKLLTAFEAFPWLAERVDGAHCLDIGASTGGFTDVLLRRGAAGVIALDVGYGLLHWRLQSDPRVVVMDRTNMRLLPEGSLPWAPAVATCDASFISVRQFLSIVARELAADGIFIVLVKPQFELPAAQVGPGGIVRDEALRQLALTQVVDTAQTVGFGVEGHIDSALAGPDGNREILLVLRKL